MNAVITSILLGELKKQQRLTVLMAEQNFHQATEICQRRYFIVHGQIAFVGNSQEELRNNELARKIYLGARASGQRRGRDAVRSENP